MNLIRHVARLSGLATAVAVIWSCDTRRPTFVIENPLDDIELPTIQFTLSAGTNNVVQVGTALTVSVTGTDNSGVGFMFTRISNGAQVIGVDTATINPIQKTATRVVPVPLDGLLAGDRIIVRATVADAATNAKTDSVIITVADTSGPALIVSTSKANRSVAGGDTLDARVTANDVSGIVYAGYRLLQVRTSDSVVVHADSTFVAPGTRVTSFQTPAYTWVLPDTLPAGNYAVVGFALDRSGEYTRAGKPGANFSLVDLLKPLLTFLSPSPVVLGTQKVGDSLLVTAHLTDNIALQKVSFVGVSIRQAPAPNTVVTRYTQVSVPSGTFRAGLRDTLIQQYLKVYVPPSAPIDTVTDTLVVIGVVTDQANNVDTVRVNVKMVP